MMPASGVTANSAHIDKYYYCDYFFTYDLMHYHIINPVCVL